MKEIQYVQYCIIICAVLNLQCFFQVLHYAARCDICLEFLLDYKDLDPNATNNIGVSKFSAVVCRILNQIQETPLVHTVRSNSGVYVQHYGVQRLLQDIRVDPNKVRRNNFTGTVINIYCYLENDKSCGNGRIKYYIHKL